MREYLVERTIKEFKELDLFYSNLFSAWNEAWDNREVHDRLYSCYVRLKIISVLLRTCIKYKFIENVTLKTKTGSISLKTFCDYCIHRSAAMYEDNGKQGEGLEVYLVIDTDFKKEVHFVINKNMDQLRCLIEKLEFETLSNKNLKGS